VVEHLTFNQGVPGSIPGRPTRKLARPAAVHRKRLPTSLSRSSKL
jgi:hypothetical protein